MVHDQASVQFLLQQSLLARAAEEEKAREEAEVKMLEDDVADKESLLLEELCKVRDGVRPPWSKFSGIEKAAVHWHVALVKARKKKGSKKRKKRRRKKLPKTSSSLLRPLPRAVRIRKSGHLSCGSSWCSVSGCYLTSPGLLDSLGDDFFVDSVFYALLGPILDASFGTPFFWEMASRILRFLVHHWIHVYVSLQRLLGYFTQVVREGGLGPCGPFFLPVHTCPL